MLSKNFRSSLPSVVALGLSLSSLGCSSESEGNGTTHPSTSSSTGAGITSGMSSSGAGAASSNGAGSGSGGASGGTASTNGTNGAPSTDTTASAAGGTGNGATATTATVDSTGGPASCAEAASTYSVSAMPIQSSSPQSSGGSGPNSSRSAFVVAAGEDGAAYVGFNSSDGTVIATPSGPLVTVPEAQLGGVAATNDGVAALLFGEMWAQVQRFDASGAERFSTDLFRSPNLEDEGTKGEASTGRLGYLSASDTLVAYFGHTQRYDDGVRHQGGYLATVDATGQQALLNGWFGSHNLDQRLWTSASAGAVIGLGDAYPIGIFYSAINDNPRPRVIYRLAAAGNGAANGQLGGIVELDTELIMPFITNLSVSPDIDAGEWPNIDNEIADQIRQAAANGTDMGLLRVSKTGDLGEGDAPTVWLNPELTAGSRLVRLKAARYGSGDLILLLWAEATGNNRNESLDFFTMVVDANGAVCQAKTALDPSYGVGPGDDIVRGPSGHIYWANGENGTANLVTLTPQG